MSCCHETPRASLPDLTCHGSFIQLRPKPIVDLRPSARVEQSPGARNSLDLPGFRGERLARADHPMKDGMIQGFRASAEIADLIAFLESLTDEEFLTNPRLSDPWPEGHPASATRQMP